MTDQPSPASDEGGSPALEPLLDDDREAFYERAPCGYLSTSADGTIVRVNGTFLAWTGHQRDELVGRQTFVDLLTPGGRIYHETHYRPMLEMQGFAREIALEVVCADGRRLPVLVNSVLERDDDNRVRVVRTAVFDATERRSYERELLEAKQRAEQAEAGSRSLVDAIQQSLLPRDLPAIAGLEISAVYRPSGDGAELGGDFYDVLAGPDGSWYLVVGDVQGKGVAAAIVTGLARNALQAAVVSSAGPQEAMTILNEVLLRSPTGRFVTVALLHLSPSDESWDATVVLGGHQRPAVRRDSGDVEAVGAPGSVLGVFGEPTFPARSFVLGPGDLFVSCTDGITEVRRDGEFFGEAGLHETIRACAGSADEAGRALLDAAVGHSGGEPHDDIVVLAVRPV